MTLDAARLWMLSRTTAAASRRVPSPPNQTFSGLAPSYGSHQANRQENVAWFRPIKSMYGVNEVEKS